MPIKKAYTFDDLLLEPKFSAISSRDTDLTTRLSKNILLDVPIISANMDDVTEYKMAKFMAENGGIGIIHRFLTIEAQAEEVRKVKRAESILIEEPYVISDGASSEDAKNLMDEKGISGLPVLSQGGKLAGIITKRDILFYESLHGNGNISDVMVKKVITAPKGISLQEAKKILCENSVKKLPLIDSENKLVGLITLKDILRQDIHTPVSKDKKGRLLVGAAVGIKKDDTLRAKMLLEAGADVLVIDTAHGHNEKVFEMLKFIKKKCRGVDVICGNVATGKAVADFIKAGADGIKIGIGPGAACTTRRVTGVGKPQMSAIFEAVKAAKKSGIPLIADGGIRNSADIAKALAAGASSVMLGSLLAGTDESPGEIIIEKGTSYKRYRGMASREAAEEKARVDGVEPAKYRVPEGVSGQVNYKGKAKSVLDVLLEGLRDSMYYLGAKNLAVFQKNAKFTEITQAGLIESYPHDMKL